jgi:hypothetical protein
VSGMMIMHKMWGAHTYTASHYIQTINTIADAQTTVLPTVVAATIAAYTDTQTLIRLHYYSHFNEMAALRGGAAA